MLIKVTQLQLFDAMPDVKVDVNYSSEELPVLLYFLQCNAE
jgi:hypothetical protein